MTRRISDLRRKVTEELPATQFVGAFPREQLSVIASAPGTGKTWFVIKTAMDLSAGKPMFCGMAKAQAPAKSVIMCGEGGFRMLTERFRKIRTESNPDNIAVYTLTDLAEANVEISLDTKDGADNMMKIIAGEKADIVYIDSLIAFRDENENEQQSTSRVLKKLITIARKCNCAIVATHHTRKRKRGDDGELTQHDIIGSSAITRLCATAWTMEDSKDSTYRKIACVKTWYKQPEVVYWRITNKDDGSIVFERATGENYNVMKERALKYLIEAQGTITIERLMEEAYVDNNAAKGAMDQFAQGPHGELTRVDGQYAIILK